jgi:hypothetical protein
MKKIKKLLTICKIILFYSIINCKFVIQIKIIMEEVKVNRKKFIKTGTTKKFNYKDLNFVIGTTDTKNTKAAFIELQMWMTSTRTLELSLNAIRRKFKSKLGKVSRIYIDGLKTSLIDYVHPCLTSAAAVMGKPTYISIEITLLADSRFQWDEDFIDGCEHMGKSLFDILLEMDEFSLQNTKKGTN